jgi:hypothetical protein
VAFIIKQHDLLPNLPFQILDAAGAPRDCSDVDTVSLVMKPKTGTLPAPFKKECSFTNVATGVGIYDWDSGDTDTSGTMSYEFELVFLNGDIQTVPVDRFLELTIQPDLG